jgi:hypothetical protein
MRTLFMLVSIAALATACSDQERPTSPVSPGARSANVDPSGDGIANPNASAAPAKYLKQIVAVDSAVIVNAGFDQDVDVSCPSGMLVTGGGFVVNSNGATPYTKVIRSSPHGPSTWRARFVVEPAAPIGARVNVEAICAGY